MPMRYAPVIDLALIVARSRWAGAEALVQGTGVSANLLWTINAERPFSALLVIQLPSVLGAKRMIAAPKTQIAAPVRSHVSGRCFSTAQSQPKDAAM
jgi:hypothetical protein